MTQAEKSAFYQAELGWLARTLTETIRFRFGLGMALFSLNVLVAKPPESTVAKISNNKDKPAPFQ